MLPSRVLWNVLLKFVTDKPLNFQAILYSQFGAIRKEVEPPTSPRFVEFLAALHIYNHASSPVISIQFDENMDGVSKFMIRFVKFNARVGLPMRILLRFFRAAREEELGKKKKKKEKEKKLRENRTKTLFKTEKRTSWCCKLFRRGLLYTSFNTQLLQHIKRSCSFTVSSGKIKQLLFATFSYCNTISPLPFSFIFPLIFQRKWFLLGMLPSPTRLHRH